MMNYNDITDDTIVLAWPNGMRLFDFYATLDDAVANADRANKSEFRTPTDPDYVLMTFGEYQSRQRAKMLDGELKECSEDDFIEALECLPPEKWHTDKDGVNKFLMCEYYTATFTTQYARFKGRYYSRMVDARDPTTWITAQEILALPVPAATV